MLHVPPADAVGKLGIPGASGWLAYVSDGVALVQLFDVDEGATYPDGGSRVEVWMQAPFAEPFAELGGWRCDARVVECEVLAPLRRLEPGDASTQRIEFRVVPLQARPVVETAAALVELFG